MRTLAIGDIHGCHTAFTILLKSVNPAPTDTFVFLGDYIDRGFASRQVIDALLLLKESCSTVFLRGNHEIMILEARDDALKDHHWQSYGGLEALESYNASFRDDWVSRIPDSHWEFFRQTKRFFETKTHIFIHGCLDAELALKDQPDWILFWEPFWKIKPHVSGKLVICGHTVQRHGKPANLGYATCIDTNPASGGWLTCLDVNSGSYWQADEKGKTRTGEI